MWYTCTDLRSAVLNFDQLLHVELSVVELGAAHQHGLCLSSVRCPCHQREAGTVCPYRHIGTPQPGADRHQSQLDGPVAGGGLPLRARASAAPASPAGAVSSVRLHRAQPRAGPQRLPGILPRSGTGPPDPKPVAVVLVHHQATPSMTAITPSAQALAQVPHPVHFDSSILMVWRSIVIAIPPVNPGVHQRSAKGGATRGSS